MCLLKSDNHKVNHHNQITRCNNVTKSKIFELLYFKKKFCCSYFLHVCHNVIDLGTYSREEKSDLSFDQSTYLTVFNIPVSLYFCHLTLYLLEIKPNLNKSNHTITLFSVIVMARWQVRWQTRWVFDGGGIFLKTDNKKSGRPRKYGP